MTQFSPPPQSKQKSADKSNIPGAIKRNIASLSESSDSIKLTDFGKSFISKEDDDIYCPSTKKRKSNEFDKLLGEESNLVDDEIFMRKIENKRLASFKSQNSNQVGLLCSPSIMESKMGTHKATSPKSKFPSEAKPQKEANEKSGKQSDTKEAKACLKPAKIDKVQKQMKSTEKTPIAAKMAEKKVAEKSTPVAPSNKISDEIDFVWTGREIMKEFEVHLGNIRLLVEHAKAIK